MTDQGVKPGEWFEAAYSVINFYTGLKDQGICNACKELEEKEYIEVKREKQPDGKSAIHTQTNKYRIKYPLPMADIVEFKSRARQRKKVA